MKLQEFVINVSRICASRLHLPRFFLSHINVHNQPQSSMTNQQHQLEYEAAEVLEMLEDMVEYVCKEHTISGEKVYFMINELSRIKLSQFPQEEEY